MKSFYIIPFILCFCLTAPGCKQAQEESETAMKEKVQKESPSAVAEKGHPLIEESEESDAPVREEGKEGK